MLEATIFTLTSVGVPIAFGSTRYFTAIQNVGRVKSSVDDLIMERGTVSMRVAFVLRSAEVQPLFRDLCDPLVMKDLLAGTVIITYFLILLLLC